MKTLIIILLFFVIFALSNCFIGGSKDRTTNVDSTAVHQPTTTSQSENGFKGDVGMENQAIGRKIDFENSGYLLSRMLKEVAFMRNFNDSSSVIQVKVLDNDTYSPIGIPQNFEAKFNKYQAGSYIEGFNGLKDAFIKSMYTGDVIWEEATYANAIRDLSELEFVQPTQDPQPFKYVDPAVITWAWQNFYRGPSTSSISDVSLSTLYDVIFKKFVRTLSIAHEELNEKGMENERSWYTQAIIMERKHAPTLLAERFIKPAKYSKDDVNEFYYPLATGFWVRRSIDGTEGLLWKYLRNMIMDYDYDWGCKNFKICDRG